PYDPDRVIASGLFLPWPEEDDIALPVTDGTTVASCGADVRLVGLFVMRADPPRGFAAVRTESGGRLVATGSELGERHVVAIERDRAVLEDGSGLRCELRLFEGGAERPVTVGAAVPRLATPPTSDVVERISDTEYRVSPAALSDLGPLLRSVAAVPSDEGLRLYGIRGTSPLAAADLRNGDTIVEIDGHPASDVNHALEAAARGQRGEPIRIVVERHGQRSERTYSLGSARD
ncbi:MAG: PDZ domain-containing protein, partial [Sandaracinaceae bacterium]